MRLGMLVAGGAALALTACENQQWNTAPPEFASSGASQTAQSIMMTADIPSSFVIVENQIWQFNQTAAKTYYTNAWDGNAPTVTCTGGGCGTPPAAPGAPAPDPLKVNPRADHDACTFWNGGTLSSSSYTQNVKLSTGSSRTQANYTYTYTYNIVGSTVDPQTAWDLIVDTGAGDVTASLSGFVAGQSVVSKTGGAWTFKYSHTMLNSDTTPRLSGLQYVLDGGAPVDLASTMETGVDYFYESNAFESTNSFLLAAYGALVSAIQQGSVPSRNGLTDNFAGNDYTNGDRADYGPVSLTLGVGDHTLTIQGTVKDNFGSQLFNVSVTRTIRVHAGACEQS